MKVQKKRILVVDDDVSITRLLKKSLEQTDNYTVEVENNATHAISTALAFQPDLILLDVLMPGMDGGELASCFQTQRQFDHVPVVFLTAAATKHEVASRGGLIGGLPFLAKPVDLPEVVACLEEHLATRRHATGLVPEDLARTRQGQ